MDGNTGYFDFKNVDWNQMGSATWETIWMTVVSIVAVAILGYFIGLLLFETSGVKVSLSVQSIGWWLFLSMSSDQFLSSF